MGGLPDITHKQTVTAAELAVKPSDLLILNLCIHML